MRLHYICSIDIYICCDRQFIMLCMNSCKEEDIEVKTKETENAVTFEYVKDSVKFLNGWFGPLLGLTDFVTSIMYFASILYRNVGHNEDSIESQAMKTVMFFRFVLFHR
jgi:hypothetical protein